MPADALITLPHSETAEKAVLGAVIMNSKAYHSAANVLTPDDFFGEANQLVWKAVTRLAQAGSGIDSLMVIEELHKGGELKNGTWFDYVVNRLLDGVPRISNVADYARIVREKSQARRLIQIGYDLQARACQDVDVKEVIAETQALLVELSHNSDARLFDGHEVATETYANIQEAYRVGKPRGILTTLPTINDCTGGLVPRRYYSLAARPRIGKTALIGNWIVSWILVELRVLLFSLEMTRHDMHARMLSTVSNVPGHKLLNSPHLLDNDDWRALAAHLAKVDKSNYQVCDSTRLKIEDLGLVASEARQRMGGLDAIVIDYMQLLQSKPNRWTASRAEYVAEISRGLKGLAKDQNAPVIALSHLNRGGTGDDADLENLSESDQIAKDADCVMILIRKENGVDLQGRPDYSYRLKIAKNRNGQCGAVDLNFNRETMTFTEPGSAQPQPYQPAFADERDEAFS